MWDPKPDAPARSAGPSDRSPPRVPGVRFCEHLPRQAAIMDKLTVIRSVDCSASDHTPITMQAGNPLARRTDDGRDGGGYPSMGSIAAKFRGANRPGTAGLRGAGRWLEGRRLGCGPHGGRVSSRSRARNWPVGSPCRRGLTIDRLGDRESLRREFDSLRRICERRAAPWRTSTAIPQLAVDMVDLGRGACGRSMLEKEDPRTSATPTAAAVWAQRPCWRAAGRGRGDLRAGERRLGVFRSPRRQRPSGRGIEKGLTPTLARRSTRRWQP